MDGRDDKLVIELARGVTSTQAARRSGYSVKTVRRRRCDNVFMQRVSEARGQMIKRATGRLAGAAEEAVTCLRHLLTSASDSVRLSASRAILESAVRFRESEEIEERITKLENQIKGNTDVEI